MENSYLLTNGLADFNVWSPHHCPVARKNQKFCMASFDTFWRIDLINALTSWYIRLPYNMLFRTPWSNPKSSIWTQNKVIWSACKWCHNFMVNVIALIKYQNSFMWNAGELIYRWDGLKISYEKIMLFDLGKGGYILWYHLHQLSYVCSWRYCAIHLFKESLDAFIFFPELRITFLITPLSNSNRFYSLTDAARHPKKSCCLSFKLHS